MKYRPGQTLGTSPKVSVKDASLTPIERFMARVEVPTDGIDSCWEWLGVRNWGGYGEFYLDGKTRKAHRVSYELVRGNIPEGYQLDHLCSNRGCVNPYHLEPVTNAVNAKRGKVNQNLRKTHCKHGHAFDEANTYYRLTVRGTAARQCRACKRLNGRAGVGEVAGLSVESPSDESLGGSA